MHEPGTRWHVLRPGRASGRVEVCLYPDANANTNAAAARIPLYILKTLVNMESGKV